ncbi:hypothetical protein HaLaN_11860 [Haematococcus lacustris]|uniref:Uncharacterized protein n=1 Tax=Haematococcus lacustris TaxID=44745 RepID=A0A699YZC5_HAELA|nr:hypothetical protein HaLaN_11860 [Haematococcus lacustris]
MVGIEWALAQTQGKDKALGRVHDHGGKDASGLDMASLKERGSAGWLAATATTAVGDKRAVGVDPLLLGILQVGMV